MLQVGKGRTRNGVGSDLFCSSERYMWKDAQGKRSHFRFQCLYRCYFYGDRPRSCYPNSSIGIVGGDLNGWPFSFSIIKSQYIRSSRKLMRTSDRRNHYSSGWFIKAEWPTGATSKVVAHSVFKSWIVSKSKSTNSVFWQSGGIHSGELLNGRKKYCKPRSNVSHSEAKRKILWQPNHHRGSSGYLLNSLVKAFR